MKVNIYIRYNAQNRHPFGKTVASHILAVNEGFKKHGIQAEILPPDYIEKCDLAVCWGVKRQGCVKSGKRALIIERGYVGDRFYWTSAGFDDLNGRADFCNKNVPSERWDRLFAQYMNPWRESLETKSVLLVGQVLGDASLRGINIRKWYKVQVKKLKELGYWVIFRPHPKERVTTQLAVDEYDDGPLDRIMQEVKFVVTYNSNVAVDAVLAGVSAVTMDRGSMAYDVTSHLINKAPRKFDRADWARRIAYTQWNIDEITSGEMWDHLKVGMET